MVRKKKSMIGFDPLAWLDGEKTQDVNSEVQVSESQDEKVVDEKVTKNSEKVAKVMLDVLGHQLDESALLKGYALATECLDEVVAEFYSELFKHQPAVKALFENTNETMQAAKLVAALKLLIENLHNEETLKSTLKLMRQRHQKYGVLPEHYPVVAELLVASFKNKIGRSWTKSISSAWMELLVAVADYMCAAYIDEEEIMPEADGNIEPENPVLVLDHIQDISKSQALKNDMLILINDNDDIDIDASEVERIDGSALQLLCALFNYANQNNLHINWINPSAALKQSVQTLGMQKILELT